MEATPDAYDPGRIEEATRQFWKARGLPAASGTIGPPTGPLIHQIVGTIASDANPVALAQGGVLADVDARFFALTGRRSVGRLLVRPSRPDAADPRTAERLADAGAWVAGAAVTVRDPELDAERIQRMVERLATMGILLRREMPLRSCPRCRVPRTLAGIIYHEEEGPAYLVRFPLPGTDPSVSLIVWTDAAWKLLGAPALLAEPGARYVTVRYRRRGGEERILVSSSSLPRLKEWLPGGEWEVVDEIAGTQLEGRAYDHPLATESPMLARPPPPSGQVHVSDEVTDSGTGFVALVPAHGAADAAASRALDLPGWPVLDRDLALTTSFRHKYQGLPVEAGEAFVLRDLREGGYLFAELTVRRGVPRCAACRTALVWETGSAWCLDPAALPAARLDLFAGLIPGERAPPSTEVVPWPVSVRELEDDPLTPCLRECARCHRLATPEAPPECPCGGSSTPQRRRLLPVFREALLAWADESPFPSGEVARLYLPARRRVPTLVHHLVAMEAADAHPGTVHASFRTTLPSDEALVGWLATSPRDASRAAFVSLTDTPRGGTAALVERRAQHALRLRRFWTLAQRVTDTARADRSLGAIAPVASRATELLDEDRALLSRFERLRRDVIGRYEAGDAAGALRLLEGFFDGPLRTLYLPAASRRLASQVASERGPVVALLAHVLTTWGELYGPVAPFTAEAVHRMIVGDGRSLFERSLTPILESALDPAIEERAARWWAIVEATRRARRHLGLDESVPMPQIVLSARDETQAAQLRAAAPAIGRLANAAKVEVASPQLPWGGRQLQVTPVLGAIQKVFGAGAPRVARILQGLSASRVRDGIRSKTLEIAVEGRPVQITPAMVEVVERIPEGFLTFPGPAGEMIVQAPDRVRSSTGASPRVLSSDAFRVLRRVRQRIRTSTRPDGVRVVVVCATGALSEELVRLAPSLATSLGVPLFRVVASTDGFPLSETTTGRTGRGLSWAIWVPGSRRPEPRTKRRATKAHLDRVRRAARRDPLPEVVVEIQSDPAVRRDSEIDRWVPQFDALLGRPLVGPAKLRAAWDAGLHSYEEVVHAPFDRLSAVPGFGPFLAAELVVRGGGDAPARPRPVRSVDLPTAVGVAPGPLGRTIRAPSGAPEALASPMREEVAPVAGEDTPPAPAPNLVQSTVGGTTLLVPRSDATPALDRSDDARRAEPARVAIPSPDVPSDLSGTATQAPGGAEPAERSLAPPTSFTTETAEAPPAPGGLAAGTVVETEAGVGAAAPLEAESNSELAAGSDSEAPSGPEAPPETDAGLREPSEEVGVGTSPPTASAADVPADSVASATERNVAIGPDDPAGPLALGTEPAAPAVPASNEATTTDQPPPTEAPLPEEVTLPAPAIEGSAQPPSLSLDAEPSGDSALEPSPASGGTLAPEPAHSLGAPPDSAHPAEIEPASPVTIGDARGVPADLGTPPPSAPPVPTGLLEPAPTDLGRESGALAERGSTSPPGEPPLLPEAPTSPPAEPEVGAPETRPDAAPGTGGENVASPPEPLPAMEPPTRPPDASEPDRSLTAPSESDAVADLSTSGPIAPESTPPPREALPSETAPIEPAPAVTPPSSDEADSGALSSAEPVLPAPIEEPGSVPITGAEDRIPDESIPPISIVERVVGPEAAPSGPEPGPAPSASERPSGLTTETAVTGGAPDREGPLPTPSEEAAPPIPRDVEAPAAPPSALEPPIPPEPEPRPLPHVGDPALATPSVAPLPIGPRASEAPPAPAPPPSGLAVSSAAVANDAWPIFLDATGAGHRGLCVSREFPDRMRALLGPRDVTVIWLSNTSRPGAVRPVDLNGLGQLVEDAITRETVRAVYLDHVEYLARVNSAAAVRELLERIDRVARAHEARVWVALNPELVTPATGEILSRGFPSAH